MQKELEELEQSVTEAVKRAAVSLEPSLMKALEAMKTSYEEKEKRCEKGTREYGQISSSLEMLSMILRNLEIAEEKQRPMCQDTGMLIAFVSVGPDSPFSMHEIEGVVNRGAEGAFVDGAFRYSIVNDPLFGRRNTGSNLPVLIHWDTCEAGRGEIHFI